MEIPFSRWFAVIARRRSRRLFDSEPIDTGLLARLKTVCEEFRPFKEARAVLVTHSPDMVFKGAIANYGKIKGAPAFAAFIGNMGDSHVHEKWAM
jgi:hypothetical protein